MGCRRGRRREAGGAGRRRRYRRRLCQDLTAGGGAARWGNSHWLLRLRFPQVPIAQSAPGRAGPHRGAALGAADGNSRRAHDSSVGCPGARLNPMPPPAWADRRKKGDVWGRAVSAERVSGPPFSRLYQSSPTLSQSSRALEARRATQTRTRVRHARAGTRGWPGWRPPSRASLRVFMDALVRTAQRRVAMMRCRCDKARARLALPRRVGSALR